MSVAPTLRRFLDDRHVNYEVIQHSPTKSSMHSAQICHVPPERLAKAVLLDTREGLLLAVLPANHRIQLSDLSAEFGQRPQLVEEDKLGRVFPDCAEGAVPPIGAGYDVDMIVDDSIDTQPDIYFEAGDHETLIHMSHGEFARLTKRARHGHFSVHEAMLH